MNMCVPVPFANLYPYPFAHDLLSHMQSLDGDVEKTCAMATWFSDTLFFFIFFSNWSLANLTVLLNIAI